MARPNRRNSHRYSPARDQVCLGWWEGKTFRTIPAQLKNLSTSGALVGMEQGCPPLTKIWICLAGQHLKRWVQAEIVESAADDDNHGSIRMKFPEVFPYECFKAAVWGDLNSNGTSSGSGSEPPPQVRSSTKGSPPGIVKAYLSEEDRIRFFLGTDWVPPSRKRMADPASDPASSHPPTLMEAHQEQMVLHDRVAHFPWLTTLVLCLGVALMLAILAWLQLENLRNLGIFVGRLWTA
jgi:hypothetical protein